MIYPTLLKQIILNVDHPEKVFVPASLINASYEVNFAHGYFQTSAPYLLFLFCKPLPNDSLKFECFWLFTRYDKL